MKEVKFTVEKIEKANKENCAVVFIKFNGSETTYNYVRKYFKFEGNYATVIDGCRIKFNEQFEYLGVERLYDTKGVFKRTTSNQVKTLGEKIKEEIIKKEVEIPSIVKEQIIESGEVHHEKFEMIKQCIDCSIPVYLAGPAGSGKNHTLEQIAKSNGWNFYFTNSVQQEFKLTGFIDAGGKFHETEFSKACKEAQNGNDVVFFLDEMDASIPEVLVLLNAAIANGYFEFPDGKVTFGNKVHFVAAGNTVGNGADELYSGRMVIDQATLDRFAIIEFDYSLKIELAITNNNAELVEFIHQLRDSSNEQGIRTTFSYRCMVMVTKLEKAGMDLATIITIAVVKGLDKDTIKTLKTVGCTKYHKAFHQVQNA